MQDIGHLILPALRGIQALFSLVTLALSATIIHWYDTHITPDNTPKSFLFLVFSGVFTILFVVPYVVFAPKHFPELVNAYASLVLEAITLIFWFAGFVAGSVYLGQIDRCRGAICTNAKASVVFAALLWIFFCITIYFPIKYCFFDTTSDKSTGAARLRSARLREAKASNRKLAAEQDRRWTEAHGTLAQRFVKTVKVRAANVVGVWREKSRGRGHDSWHGSTEHKARNVV